jgi:hypothetical protein
MFNISNLKWKTRSGVQIAIKDLSETHLANIIEYLKVYEANDDKWVREDLIKFYKKQNFNLDLLNKGFLEFQADKVWKKWDKQEGRDVLISRA